MSHETLGMVCVVNVYVVFLFGQETTYGEARNREDETLHIRVLPDAAAGSSEGDGENVKEDDEGLADA